MSRRRSRQREIEVYATINLDQFDDQDLIDELRARNALVPNSAIPLGEWMIEEVRDALLRGKPQQALALIERYSRPADDMAGDYARAMKGQHPLFASPATQPEA
jgi:hypothetical protein